MKSNYVALLLNPEEGETSQNMVKKYEAMLSLAFI